MFVSIYCLYLLSLNLTSAEILANVFSPIPFTVNKSSGLVHFDFLQYSEIALALEGPIPESAEEISSGEALLTLTGDANVAKLARDKNVNTKADVKFLIILIFSNVFK